MLNHAFNWYHVIRIINAATKWDKMGWINQQHLLAIEKGQRHVLMLKIRQRTVILLNMFSTCLSKIIFFNMIWFWTLLSTRPRMDEWMDEWMNGWMDGRHADLLGHLNRTEPRLTLLVSWSSHLCRDVFLCPCKGLKTAACVRAVLQPKNKPALLCFAVCNSKHNLHWLPLFWSRGRNPRATSKSGQIKAKKNVFCVCASWSVKVVFFLQ